MKYRIEVWHTYSNVYCFESNNKKAIAKYYNSVKHEYDQKRVWKNGVIVAL